TRALHGCVAYARRSPPRNPPVPPLRQGRKGNGSLRLNPPPLRRGDPGGRIRSDPRVSATQSLRALAAGESPERAEVILGATAARRVPGCGPGRVRRLPGERGVAHLAIGPDTVRHGASCAAVDGARRVSPAEDLVVREWGPGDRRGASQVVHGTTEVVETLD